MWRLEAHARSEKKSSDSWQKEVRPNPECVTIIHLPKKKTDVCPPEKSYSNRQPVLALVPPILFDGRQ